MSTIATPTLPSAFLHASTTTTTSSSASCTTAVPGKYGRVSDPTACNNYWSYDPSFGAAILFTVLFAIAAIVHIAQAFAYKKAYAWVLIMGVLWEFASFATRVVGTRHQQSLNVVIASQLLLLLAPLWINAFAYMTLGRLVYFFHPLQRCWGVKATSITKYFVWADIVSFLVQGTGGSMLGPGNSASTQQNGLHIYMGGVGLQEFFIIIFTILGIKFQRDMQSIENRGAGHSDRHGWKIQIFSMHAVLALISTRIIYRLIEYSRGTDPNNPLPFHEVYMYVLDATPMFLAVLVLNVFHPGRVLVGPDSKFPSRKEKKALKKQRKEEKRRRKQGGDAILLDNRGLENGV